MLISASIVFYLLNYSLVLSEVTDRYFSLIDKFHCNFDCINATFADCSDTTSAVDEHILIYIINGENENYNFETTNLKDLKNIGLSNIKGNFNGSFLKDFTSIESLSLIGFPWKNNNVEQLSDISFLTSLKSFKLYNNNLGYFWNSSKIMDLDFKNKLDCDQLLPSSIDYLELVANKISYLPNWLSNLVDLNYLNLNYNELTYIPSGIFRNMKNLQYIYLNMNRLFEIKSIYPLSGLNYLDIKMQRREAPLKIDNFAFDDQGILTASNEDAIIDLRTEPDKIKFNDLALCTTLEENKNIKNTRIRTLYLLNREYNFCILKQFQGIIKLYDYKDGVFSEEAKEIDFRRCSERSYYNSICEIIFKCNQRFDCDFHSRTTRITYYENIHKEPVRDKSIQESNFVNTREQYQNNPLTTIKYTQHIDIDDEFKVIGSNNDVAIKNDVILQNKVKQTNISLYINKTPENKMNLANTASLIIYNSSYLLIFLLTFSLNFYNSNYN